MLAIVVSRGLGLVPMAATQTLLSNALPVRIRAAASDWRLARDGLTAAVACVESHIETTIRQDYKTPDELPAGMTCLRKSRCRTVLGGPLQRGSSATCVIKIVYLPGLGRKLRPWRYGLPEAVNLLRAHDLGIRVPRVYGVGKVFRGWRIPVATALLMEDLSGYRTLRDLLRSVRGDLAAARSIVATALPLFVRVYHARCNHIDMHTANLLLPVDRVGGEPALIDFERAAFGRAASPPALALQAGKFARSCQRIVPELDMEEWLLHLLDCVAICNPALRRSMLERFRFSREHRLSIAERLYPEARAA
jgi:tRNA A-37 threonylcarbamoyl transferase component Bud32